METIEALNKMKDVLMERGWCVGSISHTNGNVCILGAHNIVVHGETCPNLDTGTWYNNPVAEALKAEANNMGFEHAHLFNDKYGRQFNEVIEFIDAAIISE